MTEELIHVPESAEVARMEAVMTYERQVCEHVRDFDQPAQLAPAVKEANALAKALTGTKMAPYSLSAARRIEWKLGRCWDRRLAKAQAVLGENLNRLRPIHSV